MKASRIHAYGGPEVLAYEDAPRPEPAKGEVLVRVHAAGVNPIDAKIRAGYLKEHIRYALPAILGWDLSGVIEAVGPGVKAWKAGDAVYAMGDVTRNGAYAEYATIDEGLLAPKPKSQDHIHAAAVPQAGLMAFHALFIFGTLQKGQKVLIHGAGGGVGSFAVQLAKWKGAYVIGTASRNNQDLLKDLGADEAIDYTAADFRTKVKDVDLVLDTVGGETQEKSFAVLKRGGTLVSTLGQPSIEKAGAAKVTAKAVNNQPQAAGCGQHQGPGGDDPSAS
jgi:NADPH:quinone reductase-like Zn-dependent oxidoreductase